jgi:hypothetical protein
MPRIPILGPIPDYQDDDFWDFTSFNAYCNYVNDVVFNAANLTQRGFDPPENAAKAYATPPATPGWTDGDTSPGAGTSGWYLSVGDLIRVLGEFRRGGSIMGTWRAKKMMAHQYGLDGPIATKAGLVYQKGGRWGGGSQVHESRIFLMPGEAELVVFVNSVPSGTSQSYLAPIEKLISDSADIDFNVLRVP